MFKDFLGKKVTIRTGPSGEITEHGLHVTETEGVLIKVNGANGVVRVINATSSNFSEIELCQ